MEAFTYINGELCCEEVPLSKIAESADTPFYVYSKAKLLDSFESFNNAFGEVPHKVCFSTKANGNLAVLHTLVSAGAGLDIVSGGELYRGLKAGADPKKVVYSGVGKRRSEIEYALKTGIMMFNVESQAELDVIDEVAGRLNTKAPIALRVNPDVDPKTHPYISTGLKTAKFGIPMDEAVDEYKRAMGLKHIEVVGVDCHIGSQLTTIEPFVEAIRRLRPLIEELKSIGAPIKYLDLGGGLGIRYNEENPPSMEEYAKAVIDNTKDLGLELVFEPGRSIAGNAGALITRALYNKTNEDKKFTIVDAAMNDLIRPMLYKSYHNIVPVTEPTSSERAVVDLVGPICETGDCFGGERELPLIDRGELVAILSAGAYGYTMASNYNARPRPAEVMVSGGRYEIVRKRETYEDLLRGESISKF
ncbi:MAG: diaminopimelate decarboxylase [Chrysiogenetes bacterium]|nr:diaminopimelate decarboxylase [Chrysiogenetes bacterium]